MGSDRNGGIWRVLWRIGVYCMFYAALLLAWCGVCAGVVLFALNCFPRGLSWMAAAPLMAVYAVALAYAIGYIVLMAGYLMWPLKPMRQNALSYRIRVNDMSAPGLMALVREVAVQMHCSMPKHVLLSAETNACVTLKSNTWTVLFPERRSMCIGGGLLTALNRQELKGIIAHEFGHVSQGAAWLRSLMAVVHDELKRFIDYKDNFAAWAPRWLRWSWWCKPAYWPAAMTAYMIAEACKRFKVSITRQYLRLNRKMEHDADLRAARAVGAETMISALSKMDTLSQYAQFYENLLVSTIADHHTISDFWDGYYIVKRYAGAHFGYNFTAADTLTDVVYVPDKPVSRLIAERPWDSHPVTRQRIRALSSADILSSSSAADCSHALLLVDPKLMTLAGRLYLNYLNDRSDFPPTLLTIDRFERNVVRKYCLSNIPTYHEAFIDRDILIDDPDAIAPSKENPFVDDNKRLLLDYIAAKQDVARMRDLKADSDVIGDIIYDGSIYPSSDPPIREVERRISAMEPDIAGIDRAVCARIKQRSQDAGDQAPYYRYCVYLRLWRLRRLAEESKRELQAIDSLGYIIEIRTPWRGRPHNLARRLFKLKNRVVFALSELNMPCEAAWILPPRAYDEFAMICRYFEQPLSADKIAEDYKTCVACMRLCSSYAEDMIGYVKTLVVADLTAICQSCL